MPTRTSTLTRATRPRCGAFYRSSPAGFCRRRGLLHEESHGRGPGLTASTTECLDTAQREAVTARFRGRMRLGTSARTLTALRLLSRRSAWTRPRTRILASTRSSVGAGGSRLARRRSPFRCISPSWSTPSELSRRGRTRRGACRDARRARPRRAPWSILTRRAQRAAHLRHKVDAFIQRNSRTWSHHALAQAEAFTLLLTPPQLHA